MTASNQADARGFAIEVQGLAKTYGTVHAVDHISFGVKKGSITALLGGNGAGKTTTLAMILGLLLPTSGTISMMGQDFEQNRFSMLPRMNFTSPYFDLPKKMTVRQNLKIYGMLYGVPDLNARIDELAAELDLKDFIDRQVGKLSAGQQTRVSLAKSLVNRPDILLMDEPTASLDPDTADRIRTYLKSYQQRTGMTILLASHNMREVERLCDYILMMRTGKIVDQGTPSDLMRRYDRGDMEQVFLDIARTGTG